MFECRQPRGMSAAMIVSREFIAARRRADAEVLAPSTPRIAFTGGAVSLLARAFADAIIAPNP